MSNPGLTKLSKLTVEIEDAAKAQGIDAFVGIPEMFQSGGWSVLVRLTVFPESELTREELRTDLKTQEI